MFYCLKTHNLENQIETLNKRVYQLELENKKLKNDISNKDFENKELKSIFSNNISCKKCTHKINSQLKDKFYKRVEKQSNDRIDNICDLWKNISLPDSKVVLSDYELKDKWKI